MSEESDINEQNRLMHYLQRSCSTEPPGSSSPNGKLTSLYNRSNSNTHSIASTSTSPTLGSSNDHNELKTTLHLNPADYKHNNDTDFQDEKYYNNENEYGKENTTYDDTKIPKLKGRYSAIANKITATHHQPNTFTDNKNIFNKEIPQSSSLTNFTKIAQQNASSIHDLDTRYCYRHNPRVRCNKIADQEKLTEIQKKLVTFSKQDQQAITNIWSSFANTSNAQRGLILQGLVAQCCFPQLSLISHEISHLLKIDFLEMLPSELALKILCYLDCQSLCNAAQVSTKWKQLADDDRVWRYMCEQHIDRKCPQCGWGLPLMAVKKLQETNSTCKKRRFSEAEEELEAAKALPKPLWKSDSCCNHDSNRNIANKRMMRKKRPWKAVYSERYTVERNWRKGLYSLKKFQGHSDGVLCCQYDNNKLLMTGSYDTTIKIWNTKTGELIRTLTGHTMGVKSLVFDDQKLISGGLDSTIKVWNWRTGECISSYTGHSEGIISVDFLDKLIVSGSADKTIKVWHVDTRTCYTLRGHSDWVTCVKIHPKSRTLFSASDDSTVKLWDLDTNKCIATYGGVENGGHTAQVQCVIPFSYTEELITDVNNNDNARSNNGDASDSENENEDEDENDGEDEGIYTNGGDSDECELKKFVKTRKNLPTHLITASLDNTVKIWDVKTGKCIRTQFGHIEGVWSIAADTFRVISGSHDKSIKIWDLQNGQCMHTFVNSSSVTCVGLGDSCVVCGLENGEVKMYRFDC